MGVEQRPFFSYAQCIRACSSSAFWIQTSLKKLLADCGVAHDLLCSFKSGYVQLCGSVQKRERGACLMAHSNVHHLSVNVNNEVDQAIQFCQAAVVNSAAHYSKKRTIEWVCVRLGFGIETKWTDYLIGTHRKTPLKAMRLRQELPRLWIFEGSAGFYLAKVCCFFCFFFVFLQIFIAKESNLLCARLLWSAALHSS